MNEIEVSYKNKAEELAAWAISLQIVDQETRAMATSLLLEAQKATKTIKNWYKPMKRASKDAYDLQVKSEKELLRDFETAIAIVKEKLSNDYLERERRTAEQQENLRKLNTNNEEWTPDIVLPEAQRSVEVDNGSVNVRPDIEIEVTDKMALLRDIVSCKYPIHYANIDLAYIKKDVKQNNWISITGIKNYKINRGHGEDEIMLDENGELLQPRYDDPYIAESVTKLYQLGYKILESWGYEIKKPVDKSENK